MSNCFALLSRRILLAWVYICMTLILTSGCGGGSVGTGSDTFEGALLTKSGAPLPGVSVGLVDFDATTVTDENGEFLLVTDAVGSRATFFFRGAGVDTVFVLDNLPALRRRIRLLFEVDVVQNDVRPLAIDIETDLPRRSNS
ncbi:MAG: hypothetical protein KDD44_02285 [Bdellovibrionales bacterium]|nr:hypothetical protein [Bdellovibrionales bacterium]